MLKEEGKNGALMKVEVFLMCVRMYIETKE
jgi:hypothetical protein